MTAAVPRAPARNKVGSRVPAVVKVSSKLLLERLGEGVVATDAVGDVFYMNPYAEAFFGVSLKDAKGSLVCDSLRMEDENGNAVVYAKRPAYRAFRTGRRIASRKYFYVNQAGKRSPVSCTAAPIVLDKRRVGAVTVFADITEERNLERAKNEFISLASHQIQVPLSIVKWYTERLMNQSDGKLNERQAALGNEIYLANQRMIETVNAMLDLSRLEMGHFVAQKSPVRIKAELEGIIGEGAKLAERKRVDIQLQVKGVLGAVTIDPRVFHVAAENLIVNAVQYAKPGGHVRVTAEKQGKKLVVSVQDDGIGIPKDQQEQIFTKFFRAKNARAFAPNGNGLGLYIVKTFIEAVKGSVWFTSAEGKGSTFFFEIPLKAIK